MTLLSDHDAFAFVRRSLELLTPLPDPEWEAFRVLLTPLTLPRGATFVRPGDDGQRIAIVVSGLMRAYYLTSSGDEATRNFGAEGEIIGPYGSALTDTPASVAIDALEDTQVFWFSHDRFRAFYDRHRCWLVMGRKVAEASYLIRERHGYALLAYDAEQRYKAFLADYPKIVDRVPLKHVASYLGITPESLSRIRRKR